MSRRKRRPRKPKDYGFLRYQPTRRELRLARQAKPGHLERSAAERFRRGIVAVPRVPGIRA